MLELEEQKEIYRDQNPIESRLFFARKGQNGVAQAQTPGAEARIYPLEPAPVVR